MRFDVYIYLRYKHKLRIDVITYIPTLANGPPSAAAAVCLLPLHYYRTGPSTGYPNIRTGYPFYGTCILHRRYCLLGFLVVDPPWICGMGSLLESAVVGSLLRWVSRKTFLAKSPADPSKNPMMDDRCGPAGGGDLKMSFWRIIRLLMISASIQKL